MFDFSRKSIESSFERSLQLLNVDYIDLLIVHDVEFALQSEVIVQALKVLVDLKLKGQIKYIGVSGYDLDFMLKVVELSNNVVDYVLSYARYTFFDTSYKDYINKFKKMKIKLILASITGMGLLTSSGPQFWHPAGSEVREVCEEIRKYCVEKKLNATQVAHAFVYESGIAHSLLLGSKNVYELAENMEAFGHLRDKLKEEGNYIREKIVKNKNYNWLNVEVEKYKKKLQKDTS